MQENNVCKVSFAASSDLICTNFVLERTACNETEREAEENMMFLFVSPVLFTVQGAEYELPALSLAIVNRGERFAVKSDEPHYYYVSFGGRRAIELCERAGGKIFATENAMLESWKTALKKADENNVDLIAESVVLFTFASVIPKKNEKPDLITEIIKYTHKNFSSPSCSIAGACKQLGYNEKYAGALFSRRKGITYTAFLRTIRIKHAVFLIEQGVVSVKNLAILCGYTDPLYFSKVFAKETGSAPKNYIVRAQSAAEKA